MCSSKTSADFHHTAWYYTPEVWNIMSIYIAWVISNNLSKSTAMCS
jgi:hypothetical protein